MNNEYMKGIVRYVNKKVIPDQNKGNGIITGDDGNSYEIRLSIFNEEQKEILDKLEEGSMVYFKSDGDPNCPTAILDDSSIHC